MKLLLLIVLVIDGLRGCSSDRPKEKDFLLPLPGVLHAESSHEFMFSLRNFNDYVRRVKLEFKKSHGDKPLFSAFREVPASNSASSIDRINVTIPSLISTSTGSTFVFLDVQTSEGSIYSDFKKVLLKSPKPPIRLFSQDKPQYRPGDHARFQLTSLDHTLRPAGGELNGPQTIPEVWVTNAAGQRLAQWRDMPIKYGIANIDFIISEEFVSPHTKLSTVTKDGSKDTWKIHFKGSDFLLNREFFVGEVAPPPVFELNATSYDSFEFGRITLTVDVCARYHFGSPLVGGEAVVWTLQDTVRKNDYVFGNATTKENGCVSIDIATNSEHFDENHLYVNVTESTHGITELKRVRIKRKFGHFRTQSYDLRMVSDFKTLPAKLNRTLTFVLKNDGEDVANQQIEFCTKSKYDPPIRRAGQSELPGQKSPFVDYSFLLPSEEYEKLPADTLQELKDIPLLWSIDSTRGVLATDSDCRTVNTAADGLVTYTLTPPAERVHTVNLWASQSTSTLFHREFRVMTSPTGSHMALHLPHLTSKLPCKGDVKLKVSTTVTNPPPFQYQVMARGRVVADGVADSASPLDLTLHMTPEMSPRVKVVVYAQLADGEVMADSVVLPVETCLPNEVSVKWDQKEVAPGSSASLHVTAAPHSRCTVTVKEAGLGDRRRDTENLELSLQRIEAELNGLDLDVGTLEEDPSVDKYCGALESKLFDILLKAGVQSKSLDKLREGWTDHNLKLEQKFTMEVFADANLAFENAGFRAFSRRGLLNRPCIKKESPYWRGLGGRKRREAESPRFTAYRPQPYFVHDDRAEVFYQDEHILDAHGSGHVTLHLPGQATSWVASAVCGHTEKGLGISKKVSIRTSKFFFSTISIPHSVQRGDYLNGSITVFNNYDSPVSAFLEHEVPHYIDTDAEVVHRPLSLQLKHYEFCVAAHRSVTFPLSLRFDTVQKRNISVSLSTTDGFCEHPNTVHPPRYVISKEVTILPDGFPQEEISTHFACPDERRPYIVSVPLEVPVEHTVRNSAWLSVSVAGDPEDPPSLQLERSFKRPDGGAETNTLTTLLNVYGYKYFNTTGQMTSELKTSLDAYITEGVDLILREQRADRSYSTYGDEDSEGSLWLTVQIMKMFHDASAFHPYVASHFREIVNIDWVMRHQRSDGCFYPAGELLHQELRGGVEREAVGSLTANVVLALHDVIDSYRLVNSLTCLNTYVRHAHTSRYTKALIAYTFLELGLERQGTLLVQSLMDHHITEGRKMLYWHEDHTVSGYGTRPMASLEMTSYMVASLVHISGPHNMQMAHRAANWIVKQLKEPEISAQVRATALQALSAFSGRTYGSKSISKVFITVGDSMPYSVYVNPKNRRLFQTYKIRPVTLPTEVHFAVTGECVNLQTSLRYASKIRVPKPYYNVRLSTTELVRARSPGSLYTVHVCAAVRPGGLTSDKATVLIELPQSFVPVSDTLWRQVYDHKIKEFASLEHSVAITMTKVGEDSKCFDFRMLRAAEKEGQEEISLSINDAHEHSLQATITHTLPEVHQDRLPHY